MKQIFNFCKEYGWSVKIRWDFINQCWSIQLWDENGIKIIPEIDVNHKLLDRIEEMDLDSYLIGVFDFIERQKREVDKNANA